MTAQNTKSPQTLLLGQIQQGLNRLLHYDPDTRAALAELEGRVFAIEVRGPQLSLYLLPASDGLVLTTGQPERVDVTISGRPLALLTMLTRREASQGQVEIRGDIHLAQRLQTIARQMDIDWDEFLARYVGDSAAHQLGRLGRGLRRQLQTAGQTFQRQVNEYLQYEQTWLARREELDSFNQSVDNLRDDIERAAQRLQRLERQRDEH